MSDRRFWGGGGGWWWKKARSRGREVGRTKGGAGGRPEPNGAIRHADDEAFRQIKSRK